MNLILPEHRTPLKKQIGGNRNTHRLVHDATLPEVSGAHPFVHFRISSP